MEKERFKLHTCDDVKVALYDYEFLRDDITNTKDLENFINKLGKIIDELEEENKQLKEEMELLDEDRQFKTEMWTKFADKCKTLTQQFKQSQNQKAIEELVKVIDFIRNADKRPEYWDISQFIDSQIKDLKGSKK